MPQKTISSVDIAALVSELRFFIHSRMTHIYQISEEEFLFQFHVPGRGKQLLRVLPGKFLCQVEVKQETPLKPSGFSMQLRKYLDNAFVTDFYQKDSERIVVFELERVKKKDDSTFREKYFLIAELFSKGNIVLASSEYQIIACLDRQNWKDRIIKPGEKYLFPPSALNWKVMTEEDFISLLKQSTKRNLATFLATDVGLGGLYAEDICYRASVNKDKLPPQVTTTEATALFATFTKIKELLGRPKGHIYQENITPFPLARTEPWKVTKTYNEAIATILPPEKTSPFAKRINSLQKTTQEQEESIRRLGESAILDQKKGETIYENYTLVQKLLENVALLRKKITTEELMEAMKREKKIKKFDLNQRKVTLELA